MDRVALVTGDTAGHTFPALALADAWRQAAPDAQLLFVGSDQSVSASIVREAGYRFVAVPGSPIRRASLVGLMRAGVGSLHAMVITRRLLFAEQVQVVMGFGSFSTGGVLLAARMLGLPTMILEANVELGLANRWLRPWVTRVHQGLAPAEAPVLGVPVRQPIVRIGEAPRHHGTGRLRVLVVSGSRGADFFASRLPRIFGDLRAQGIRVTVHQQAPAPANLRAAYTTLQVDAVVDPFIDDIANAYAAADVVIARAGANTIAELAVAGVPALLVPLADASADHQTANAALWQAAGAGLAMSESTWRDDAVLSWLRDMAGNAAAWRAHVDAARRLARPNAARDIAAEGRRLAAARQ